MQRARARAKINLTLKVRERRADGHHELESLVAFAGVGDEVGLLPDAPLGVEVAGPFGAQLAAEPDNLILKAARLLAERAPGLRLGRFSLIKRLPVASGIGGGSADAAAALRLLARLNGLRLDDPRLTEAARLTGADVPVCLHSQARVMRGVGAELGPKLTLPKLFAVLVNPGVPVSTAEVFKRLGLAPGESLAHQASASPAGAESWQGDAPETAEDVIAGWLTGHGNDLEAPAAAIAPAVGRALDALRGQAGCRLARMSGSGATCFGLFDDCRASAEAARGLAASHPAWWIKPTALR